MHGGGEGAPLFHAEKEIARRRSLRAAAELLNDGLQLLGVGDAGMLITIEGIDQSGKKTQTGILKARLEEMGYKVEVISFPDYTTPLGREIQRFLGGEVKYSPEVRQLLFALNRYERRDDLKNWLAAGKMVIANRYTESNLAYGMAQDLDPDWLRNVEKGMPVADLAVLIDVTPDVTRSRKADKDIYERDSAFLLRCRQSYLKLAEDPRWVTVDGNQPVDDVAGEIWARIAGRLKANR